MTWKRIVDVHDQQIVINLPADFRQKKVLVVVEDIGESKAEKITRLKQASSDPLFLADIEEIRADFKAVDGEGL
ncbi:hypothetical protein [Spirosoma pomorum]